jgi:hypothetical protein
MCAHMHIQPGPATCELATARPPLVLLPVRFLCLRSVGLYLMCYNHLVRLQAGGGIQEVAGREGGRRPPAAPDQAAAAAGHLPEPAAGPLLAAHAPLPLLPRGARNPSFRGIEMS